MNKYLFILLLISHLGFAVKEADSSNFKDIPVARLSQRTTAPIDPIIVAIHHNNNFFNYFLELAQPAYHQEFEYNYQQALNHSAAINYGYNF